MSDQYEECPVCGWGGKIAEMYNQNNHYYIHYTIHNGELYWGTTCRVQQNLNSSSRDTSILDQFCNWISPTGSEVDDGE